MCPTFFRRLTLAVREKMFGHKTGAAVWRTISTSYLGHCSCTIACLFPCCHTNYACESNDFENGVFFIFRPWRSGQGWNLKTRHPSMQRHWRLGHFKLNRLRGKRRRNRGAILQARLKHFGEKHVFYLLRCGQSTCLAAGALAEFLPKHGLGR